MHTSLLNGMYIILDHWENVSSELLDVSAIRSANIPFNFLTFKCISHDFKKI